MVLSARFLSRSGRNSATAEPKTETVLGVYSYELAGGSDGDPLRDATHLDSRRRRTC